MKKKNRTWRAAALLLVLTLITSCFVGGTFAKYVTTADGSDSARVAKFGVTITANGNMFAQAYTDDAVETTDTSATVKVAAAGGKDLVAPGTKGTLANATITGTPEVSVNVTYAAELKLENWTVDSTEYCPLVIRVGDETYGIKGIKDYAGAELIHGYDTIAEYITAVQNAIAGYSKTYAPNTNLGTIGAAGTDGYVNVSWEWAFTGNNDDNDTKLGNAASAPTVDLKITTTVTQVD